MTRQSLWSRLWQNRNLGSPWSLGCTLSRAFPVSVVGDSGIRAPSAPQNDWGCSLVYKVPGPPPFSSWRGTRWCLDLLRSYRQISKSTDWSDGSMLRPRNDPFGLVVEGVLLEDASRASHRPCVCWLLGLLCACTSAGVMTTLGFWIPSRARRDNTGHARPKGQYSLRRTFMHCRCASTTRFRVDLARAF